MGTSLAAILLTTLGMSPVAKDCAALLSSAVDSVQAVTIIIHPDGTEESGAPSGPSKEEIERRERDRQREEEDYWRKRIPQIVPREDIAPQERKPVPGQDFPVVPHTPQKTPKKDLPN